MYFLIGSIPPKLRRAAYRASSGFHAGFEVVLNLHRQVKANFIIQLALNALVLEQATEPGGNYADPTHRLPRQARLIHDEEAFDRRTTCVSIPRFPSPAASPGGGNGVKPRLAISSRTLPNWRQSILLLHAQESRIRECPD